MSKLVTKFFYQLEVLKEGYILLYSLMPFLFKTSIQQSSIHGKGVFALETIPQKSIYWVYECSKEKEVPIIGCQSRPNKAYTQVQLQAVKDPSKMEEIFHGGFYYEEGDVFIELKDGTHFMNHSDHPNSQIVYNTEKDYRKLFSIASRDIQIGEEITEFYGNYFSSKAKWIDELMKKYFSQRIEFECTIAPVKPLGERNK